MLIFSIVSQWSKRLESRKRFSTTSHLIVCIVCCVPLNVLYGKINNSDWKLSTSRKEKKRKRVSKEIHTRHHSRWSQAASNKISWRNREVRWTNSIVLYFDNFQFFSLYHLSDKIFHSFYRIGEYLDQFSYYKLFKFHRVRLKWRN